MSQQLRNNENGGLVLAAIETALDLLKEDEDDFGASGEEDLELHHHECASNPKSN